MHKIKRLLCTLLTAVMLSTTTGAAQSTSLLAFGGEAVLSPYINEKGATMMPVRYFVQCLHIPADFEAQTQTVILTTDNAEVTLKVGDKKAKVNGVETELICAPENRNGYVFVPVREICNFLGYDVEWIADMRCINITARSTMEKVSIEVSFAEADAAAKAGNKEIGEIKFEPMQDKNVDYIKDREKHVLAFIMGNERNIVHTGQWRGWNNAGRDSGHKPDDEYPDGKRDIAGVFYPSIGLYDALDPDYLEYRLQLFKMAYIDTASYYTIPDDDFKNIIKTDLLPLLEKYDITACLRLSASTYAALGLSEEEWKKKFFDEIDEYVALFGERNLRIDNRPVVVIFNGAGITADEVREWKSKFEKEEDVPFVMRWLINTFKEDQKGAYDGMYDWVSTGSDRVGYLFPNNHAPYKNYSTSQFAKYHHILDLKRADDILDSGNTDYYAASVSPGFDDTAVWGWGSSPSKNERGENGDVYEFKWKYSIDGRYPMIGIPTWDDWGEGSGIEPTLEFGNEYLELTRKYAAQYFGITPNDGDFNIPDRIYKIRKTTKDAQTLADMDKACELMAQEKYKEAGEIVNPYAEALGICDVYTLFKYPDTATNKVDYPKEEQPPKDGKIAIKNNDGSVTYYPVADTYIRDGSARSSNFGSSTGLTIKNSTSGMNRKAYIKFDTTDKKKDFSKATLKLYISSLGRHDRKLMVYETDNGWSEEEIVWLNAPEAGDVYAKIDTPSSMSKKWVTADITELVKKHYGKEFSIMIVNEGTSSEENQLNFGSRELNDKEPQLILE